MNLESSLTTETIDLIYSRYLVVVYVSGTLIMEDMYKKVFVVLRGMLEELIVKTLSHI